MNNSHRSGGMPMPFQSTLSRSLIVILATLVLNTGVAHAQYGPDDEAETLEAMRPKADKEADLPPFPKPQDLLIVDTGPTAKQNFAIDTKSLTVSPDHIIRYTVVATSPSGAQNISYEGIDCTTRTLKHYAFGTNDGKWVRARNDKWERVSSLSQNQLPFTLHTQYFCQAGLSVGTSKHIVERIRYSRILEYSN